MLIGAAFDFFTGRRPRRSPGTWPVQKSNTAPIPAYQNQPAAVDSSPVGVLVEGAPLARWRGRAPPSRGAAVLVGVLVGGYNLDEVNNRESKVDRPYQGSPPTVSYTADNLTSTP